MKKILVVDDVESVRQLLKATLIRAKYEILTASDAVAAIEKAKNQRPDLIIMDVTMPGRMNGLDATRILKMDPETRGCAIIILTGSGLEEDSLHYIEAGADGYFAKPFSPLKLIRKVEEMLFDRTTCSV
jgi:two-component system, OmpR family, phosphate regulon response regulator PhoB